MGCMLSCIRLPDDQDLYGDCPDQRDYNDHRSLANDLFVKCAGDSSSRMLQATTALDHEDSHEQNQFTPSGKIEIEIDETPSLIGPNTVTKASKCSCGSTEESDECPICLEVFEDENSEITLLCNHQFHLGCVYAWMERSATCPLCGRMMLFEDSFL